MKNLWKKFDEITGECYIGMIQEKKDTGIWDKGFATLMEIIQSGREKDPDYAKELFLLDEETDYQYDIQGWIEDYMDELDINGRHQDLRTVCKKLMDTFCWEEDSPSELRFRIVCSFLDQGMEADAIRYAKDWEKEEPDNPLVEAALIYAQIAADELEEAEERAQRLLNEESVCEDKNVPLFNAAVKLYEAMGNQEAARKLNKKIDQYDEQFKKYFDLDEDMAFGDDFDDDWDEDDDLPF